MTNEEAVNFDTKYQGQDVKTAVYNSEYKNTPTIPIKRRTKRQHPFDN